ncbi:GNAT family N-acetyltransferase [Cochleicola gelatinilyticus]|uniref:GCN5 family acetyltransferase n=1 Tax=Cochleicola gelatinilyticus TaxID=1763537 RepID=A0A167HSW2_9FLAO|nr:GNAT family protein [Cochleicola gelatinilyticus]OAB78930.1 GCN5 family acetyltransferase [Cochleicola gelatinilyticus]
MTIDFNRDYILENNRVSLRPLVTGDYDRLKEFSRNEPELWTYSLLKASGKENLKHYIDVAVKAREAGTSYPFIVYDKHKKAYAGTTRFYDYSTHHKTTSLGYTWYGKEFQRTGLNPNCKFLLLEFAFEVLELERVEFRADNNNARSIAAMKSIGCTVEGVLRNNATAPDGRRDSIVLSILKSEWEKHVKTNLQKKL